MGIINNIKEFFTINGDPDHKPRPFNGHSSPPPPPTPKKKKRTIDQILNAKHNDCNTLIVKVDGDELIELSHSIDKDSFKLETIGTITLFDEWTKKIRHSNKIEIYSTEINKIIKDFGRLELKNVIMDAPDNKKLTIKLIWAL